MSTKIGIIAEGPIDHALLGALLERIAQDRANYDWPVAPDDVAEIFQIRKRGHGGVLETLRKLVTALSSQVYDYAFYVILLDRKTAAVQQRVRKLLSSQDRFVLGIAIEEIEAWWLADRKNTLAWAGLDGKLPKGCRYASPRYSSEKDPEPKKTLHELTQLSDRFDRTYGDGNVDMAIEFDRKYWRSAAQIDTVCAQCPRGFQPFEKAVASQFRFTARRKDRLF